MIQRLLLAGMLSGLVVALIAFSFARVYSEPSIERAIALEESSHHGHADAHEESVSRSMQRNAGLFVGIASYCIALGGFLAIGLSFFHGRLRMRARSTVWMLTTAGYIALVLVPQLKYPASPPGIGTAETIGIRTELYFVLVMASALSMILAAWIAYRLAHRFSFPLAVGVGAATFVALASAWIVTTPTVSEVPRAFPMGLLLEFRVNAGALQLIVWSGLGIVFGKVAEHVVGHGRADASRPRIPHA
jgi:Probable cobalt transporter subunit (CbtA)